MESDKLFLLIMIIGVIIILGTEVARATNINTATFCAQNIRNPLCTIEGVSFEKPFTIESTRVTLIEQCDRVKE